MLKELSSTPLFKNVKVNYKESEISFSKWVSKLFNGTYFKDSEGKPVRFDFRTEMGLATQLLEQSLFVLANEVVIRRFLYRLETCFGDKNEAHSFVCGA